MTTIEKIRSEIERLYDGEAPKHDQQCDFDDGYFTGIGAVSKFLGSFEEPTSDDLEEAAEEYGKRQGLELKPFAKKYFKAGAEWMAGQGKTYEDIISAHETLPILPMKEVYEMGFDYGDRVVVQIRKK